MDVISSSTSYQISFRLDLSLLLLLLVFFALLLVVVLLRMCVHVRVFYVSDNDSIIIRVVWWYINLKCPFYLVMSSVTCLLSNYLLPPLPSFFFLLLKISSFVVYISSFSLYCVLYYIQFHFK